MRFYRRGTTIRTGSGSEIGRWCQSVLRQEKVTREEQKWPACRRLRGDPALRAGCATDELEPESGCPTSAPRLLGREMYDR